MKRILAVLLSALLVLTVVFASAEAVNAQYLGTVNGQNIVLNGGNAELTVAEGMPESVIRVTASREGVTPVVISVVASELYGEASMAELSEEELAELQTEATSAYENAVVDVDITPSNNMYLHICSGEAADIDTIFTLYKGFFVELTQYNEDFAALNEADSEFLHELLYALDFEENPVEDGNPSMSMDLALKANPSTGYVWTGSSSNEQAVVVVDNGFYTGDDGEIVGAPGYAMLRIDGIAEGDAVVTLCYGRNGEKPIYTIEMDAIVDEYGNVFVYNTVYSFE